MTVLLGDNSASVSIATPGAYAAAADSVQIWSSTYTAVGGAMASAHIEVVALAANIKVVPYNSSGSLIAVSGEMDCTAGGELSAVISGSLIDSAEYYLGSINDTGSSLIIHRLDTTAWSCKEIVDSYLAPGSIIVPGGNANRNKPRIWIESALITSALLLLES